MFILFYCLPYNTLYHLRDWSHGVERFALSECILFVSVNGLFDQLRNGYSSDIFGITFPK